MDPVVKQLEKSEVFSQFPPDALRELMEIGVQRQLKQAENLCLEGEPWPHVIFILTGTLRSYILSPDGRLFVTGTWDAGMEFWGHSLFDGEGMPSTTQAIIDCTYLFWQGEDVLNHGVRHPAVMRALLKRQTCLIRRRRNVIQQLAFSPVTSRVAKLIMGLFAGEDNDTVQRDLTLEEMAARVATSPEVVCRVLQRFQENGIVELKRASITLKNREGLLNLVEAEQ